MFNDQEGLEILDSMLNGTATIEETVIINGAAVVMIKNILKQKNQQEQIYLLAPKELYTWYCPMTIRSTPLFEHTPVLNNNFEYWCRDDFVDCDFYED